MPRTLSADPHSRGRHLIRLIAAFVAVGVAPAAHAATLTTIWTFKGPPGDGSSPGGFSPHPGLAVGAGGTLFVSTGGGPHSQGAIIRLTPPTASGKPWTEQILYALSGNLRGPYPVIADAAGTLYGTALSNGATPAAQCGVAFRLAQPASKRPPWSLSLLHTFSGDKDGCLPLGGLTLGPAGVLYGSTLTGGGSSLCGSFNGVPTGCGTIYSIAPQTTPGPWKTQVDHSFGSDGAEPYDAPVSDPGVPTDIYIAANFGGGPKGSEPSGEPGDEDEFDSLGKANSVFSTIAAWYKYIGDVALFPAGSPTPVAKGVPGGGKDESEAAVEATSAPSRVNVVVGTTTGGGTQSTACSALGNNGCGVVYRLVRPASLSGSWALTILHKFTGGADGTTPYGRLLVMPNGVIWGTTSGGDVASDKGTVFSLTPSKTSATGYAYAVVHRFTGADGAAPYNGLVASGGVIYGTASYGGTGSCGCGTVFKITP